MRYFIHLLPLLLVCSFVVSPAQAHFAWLYSVDGSARLYFGEGLADRDYHLPEAVANAEVWHLADGAESKQLAMVEHEEEGFTGLKSEGPIDSLGCVKTSIVYGSYHGSKLTYYVQHFPSSDSEQWPSKPLSDTPLQALLQLKGDHLQATIQVNGKPLPGAKLSLSHESGGEGQQATANEQGAVMLPATAISKGLNGIMVMHVDKEDQGEVNGEKYTSATHILTATFNYAPSEADAEDSDQAETVSAYAPLPEEIASFGGAVCDGWLYVYSGHTGTEHEHTRENLSQHFCRIQLDGGQQWEELPMQTPLQGVPLVAHGGKLYRVGGLNHRNAPDEDEDMHSTDSFACYDPAQQAWVEMPNLPAARSSHDAVVIGDAIYVVGGWKLSGSSPGDWLPDVLMFDLSNPDSEWKVVTQLPVLRRAIAAAHLDGKLVVLGGMKDEGGITSGVASYDPQTDQWTELPELPGRAGGFGVSAWNLGGTLYASGMEGIVHALPAGASEWQEAAQLDDPRFFHRLLPANESELLVVAGASIEEGHVGTIERVSLED